MALDAAHKIRCTLHWFSSCCYHHIARLDASLRGWTSRNHVSYAYSASGAAVSLIGQGVGQADSNDRMGSTALFDQLGGDRTRPVDGNGEAQPSPRPRPHQGVDPYHGAIGIQERAS